MDRGRASRATECDVDHPVWSSASHSALAISFHALSGSRVAVVSHAMATKQIAKPLVGRSLAFSSSQHICRPAALRCPFDFFPARRRRLSHHRPARSAFFVGQRRAFSNTLRARYAAVDDSINPRELPRESDEVDVCIVGGGGSPRSWPIIPSRTWQTQPSHLESMS